METNLKKIFILCVGGVPASGKSFLAEKICAQFKNAFDIKYLNFDIIENINKDNY
jgi:uridine kinase